MKINQAAIIAASSALFAPAWGFAPQPNTKLINRLDNVAQHMALESLDLSTASTTVPTISSLATLSTTSELPSALLSFSDQGQNLAGIFFQASLLPYLTFLYFLNFRGNRTPDLGKFGFAYLLLFVLGTIPSGIVTKSVYGETLANVDWLHGGAEALLTVTNVLIVSIFCLQLLF
jgi:hypothetical protein